MVYSENHFHNYHIHLYMQLAILDKELAELFADCSVPEKQLILKMVRDMKKGLRAGKA